MCDDFILLLLFRALLGQAYLALLSFGAFRAAEGRTLSINLEFALKTKAQHSFSHPAAQVWDHISYNLINF